MTKLRKREYYTRTARRFVTVNGLRKGVDAEQCSDGETKVRILDILDRPRLKEW